jgi:hypothetical protein
LIEKSLSLKPKQKFKKQRREKYEAYGLDHFYLGVLTPWLLLTPDLQVLRGAQKDTVTIGQDALGLPTVNKKSVGTATVLRVRLQVVF